MIDRRSMLKYSGAAALGTLALSAVASGTDLAFANGSTEPPQPTSVALLPDPATTVVPNPPFPKGLTHEERAHLTTFDELDFDVFTHAEWSRLSESHAKTIRAHWPDGHYTDDSMKATVVPNRNAILLSIATGLAVATGADTVATAVHAGDHPIYPDCRPAFITAFEHLAQVANEGFVAEGFKVTAPYLNFSKADIVARGAALGVPFDETWSCYRGGELHCGRCGTCVERIEAFELADVADPTPYETSGLQDVTT